jgi:3-oxoadipate enol-lactonase
MIATTPRDGFVRAARALQDYDFSAYPAALRGPALFLAGAGDGVLPDGLARMATSASNASFVAIPEAGHLPNIEQPARFNQALGKLLDTPLQGQI